MPSALHPKADTVSFPPTRKAAVKRLAEFLPNAGRAYQAERNFDGGPDQRGNVSRLSPYLTRRMVLEEDFVRDVLSHHTFEDAEKFIQEICWRTYWKGWLALRPKVWSDFVDDLSKARAQELLRWAMTSGVDQVVAVEGQVGETSEQLAALRVPLAEMGVPLHTVRRGWDVAFYPHATRGFFPFKQHIPGVLDSVLRT